jgi:hypothetical protein
MAEREGFEPPVPFRVHLISSPPPYPDAVSTEHTTYKEIKPFLSAHLYDFTGRHRENSDNSRTVDLGSVRRFRCSILKSGNVNSIRNQARRAKFLCCRNFFSVCEFCPNSERQCDAAREPQRQPANGRSLFVVSESPGTDRSAVAMARGAQHQIEFDRSPVDGAEQRRRPSRPLLLGDVSRSERAGMALAERQLLNLGKSPPV